MLTVILAPESPEKFSRSLESKAADCIRDALEATHSTVRMVPSDKFRQFAFLAGLELKIAI